MINLSSIIFVNCKKILLKKLYQEKKFCKNFKLSNLLSKNILGEIEEQIFKLTLKTIKLKKNTSKIFEQSN